jgi:protein-disulfide isomerase-like protein with CxxC motif
VGAIHAWYYTDPACAWSWSVEPHVRRLTLELEGQLELTYVMGGIREFAPGAEEAVDWLEASAASGMPVDVRPWLEEGAPASSYPACIAVKAAAEQADPAPYLRALREGFAFRRRRLDHAEAFESLAHDLGGLDLDRLRIDLRSHAMLEAFGADLERARAVDDARRSEDQGRVRLPALELRGDDGKVHGVYGPAPWESYRDVAIAAGARLGDAGDGAAPEIDEALRRFGTMATVEVAAICDLPGPRAAAELWRLASEWRVRPETTLGGEVWSLA